MKNNKEVCASIVILMSCMIAIPAHAMYYFNSDYWRSFFSESQMLLVDRISPDVLVHAVRNGNFREVEACLNNGADSNACDTHGSTPLVTAAKGHNKNIVTLLLERRADVNASNRHGVVPLIGALFDGSDGIVEQLIDARANVNARCKNGGLTPVLLAALRGRTAAVELFLKNGAGINDRCEHGTALNIAVSQRNKELVMLLLKHNAMSDTQELHAKHTPLTKAIMLGHDEIARILVGGKADIETPGFRDIPPLAYAALQSNEAMVSLLLEARAVVDKGTKNTRSPLSAAVGLGSIPIACALIRAGADYSFAFEQGTRRPMMSETSGTMTTRLAISESARNTMMRACELYAAEVIKERDGDRAGILALEGLVLAPPLMAIVCDYLIEVPRDEVMRYYFAQQIQKNKIEHAKWRYRMSYASERLAEQVFCYARGVGRLLYSAWSSRSGTPQALTAHDSALVGPVTRCCAEWPECVCSAREKRLF